MIDIRKHEGSFQQNIPGDGTDQVLLTEDFKGRSFLRIRNTGAAVIYLTFGQTNALGTGEPLPSNEVIEFDQYESCPDGRVVAACAVGVASSVSVVFVRIEGNH